ncbi:hypothetical protein M120_5174 [Bacteroides fragilis str. 3783N1-8]|nr:hypothetical protein M120_5174 [Bacteroides fragilis str. 3783N1-8]
MPVSVCPDVPRCITMAVIRQIATSLLSQTTLLQDIPLAYSDM